MMRRGPLKVAVAFIAITATALVGAVALAGSAAIPEGNGPGGSSTAGPLSPDEMMDMLANRSVNQELSALGDAVEPGKIYRWNDPISFDASGRYGFILISNDENGVDNCLIDFDRSGSVRQTINANGSELFLQIFENTNCSEESFAGVVLSSSEEGITIEALNDPEIDQPYVDAARLYIQIDPVTDPTAGPTN